MHRVCDIIEVAAIRVIKLAGTRCYVDISDVVSIPFCYFKRTGNQGSFKWNDLMT